MTNHYHYTIPIKTRILNVFRRLFMYKRVESHLIKKIETGHNVYKKLVPPEYLYRKGSERVVKKQSLVLELDISNVVDHEIYFDLYEKTFRRFIKSLGEVKCFWDIGANIGWTTLQVHDEYPQASIVSFEPAEENRLKLARHIMLNKVNAVVIPCGLGKEKSSSRLYNVLASNPGMNRILDEELDLPYETIMVLQGDQLWKERHKPLIDCVKIDVEGFEMNVLKGLSEMIQNNKPALFIEVDNENLQSNGSSALELLTWLQDKGYHLSFANGGGVIDLSNTRFPKHFDIVAR